MQIAIVSLLFRSYWLTTHVTALQAGTETQLRRAGKHEEVLEGAAEGARLHMRTELLDLGLPSDLVDQVLTTAKANVLRDVEQRERPN